jgi:hypothetical protein
MRYPELTVLLVLLAQNACADEVYRWRDSDGATYYSDIAPPPQARDAARKRLGDRPPEPVLPYALRVAQRDFPVMLFVAEGCGQACGQAGAYLARRGVPYTERNATAEDGRDALAALSGGKLEVPLLTIGKSVLRGFQEAAWSNALDAAGYPRTSILPQGMSARQQPKPVKEPVKAAAAEASVPTAAAGDARN